MRLPAYKRTAATNPHNLYAVPREKSVQRFREQIRNLTRRRAPVRLSAMIEALNPVIRGWGNYYRKANVRTLFHRLDGWIERRLFSFIAQAMAEHGVAALSHVPSGERVRTGPADPSGAWDQDHPPSTATTTQESGLRENRTSRLSERTEEGPGPSGPRCPRAP